MTKSLRAWRTERLLSTRRLAELAGSSNKTIVQLENGRQTATFATIEKLSRVLEVEPREVLEFSRALDVRAGLVPDGATTMPESMPLPRAHVFCASEGMELGPLAAALLATGRYGVTLAAGVPLLAEQIASTRPDIVVLAVDDDATRTLLHGLLADGGPLTTPLIITSRNHTTLTDIETTLAHDDAPPLTFTPLDRNAHALMLAVEACRTPA